MTAIRKPGITDIALLLLVAIIWGSAFSSIKVLVAEIGAIWAAALRVCVGFAILIPFFLFSKSRDSITMAVLPAIIMVALLNMVIPFILISWALKHVDAGVGSLLLATTPFIAMVIGHFTTKDERITKLRALAVFCAMSGIAILVGPEAFTGIGSSAFLAQMAIVASGACYVTAGFVMRRISLDAVPFTTTALGTGAAILLVTAVFFGGQTPSNLSTEALVNLLWLGIAPTGLAYLLRYWLITELGVSTFALAMNAVPIFGILIGAVYLGEVIHFTTIVSLILVMCGLAIARKAAPTKPTTG